MLVVIRGAGDLASGIALRLYRAGARIVMLDVEVPTAVRRSVAFSEAIRLDEAHVEGIKAVRELGSERRETVRSLSAARVGNLRKAVLSTRGPGRTNLWYVSCTARCMADWLRSGGITAESI